MQLKIVSKACFSKYKNLHTIGALFLYKPGTLSGRNLNSPEEVIIVFCQGTISFNNSGCISTAQGIERDLNVAAIILFDFFRHNPFKKSRRN